MSDPFEHHPEARDRHQNLQPALSQLAKTAILTYDALKPHAQNVDEVDPDFPVRQEDFELGGRIVGHYVRISFGEHHRLSIYNNRIRTNILGYSWQFTRSRPIGALETETVKVTKFPSSPADGVEGFVDIATYTHIYPMAIGKNAKQNSSTCNLQDNYSGAEAHIAAFQTDLEDAINKFAR